MKSSLTLLVVVLILLNILAGCYAKLPKSAIGGTQIAAFTGVAQPGA